MPDEIDWTIFQAPTSEWEPGIDLLGLLRNYRHRIFPGTITYHNDEIRAGVAYPFGVRWRTVGGLQFCPLCMSISPRSLLYLIESKAYWNPFQANQEMRALVQKGEMNPSSLHTNRSAQPVNGSGYGVYTFNPMAMQPSVVSMFLHDRRYNFSLGHLQDASKRVKAALVLHLGRMAPEIQWTFDENGGLLWAHAVPPQFIVIPNNDGGDEGGEAETQHPEEDQPT